MQKRNCDQSVNVQEYFSRDVTYAAKGVAIVFMLIHHLFSCFPEWYEQYSVASVFLTEAQVMNLSVLGKICVAIFVFLSAYGMAVGFEKSREDSRRKQVAGRYLKLAGSFGFVYLLSILTCWFRADHLAVYGWGTDWKRAIWNMVIDGLGLANLFGTPTYNETWWYMSVAILMIFFIPILYKAYENYGIFMVPVSAMASMLGIATDGVFTSYLFAAVLGICAAKEHFTEKMGRIAEGKRAIPLFIIGAAAFAITAKIRLIWGYMYWLDAILAVLLVLLIYIVIDLKHVRLRPLVFLGKYSMNMFLIHTLIFEYYCTDFIYSFRHWALITAVLTAVSLIASVAIEFLKKLLDRLIKLSDISKKDIS